MPDVFWLGLFGLLTMLVKDWIDRSRAAAVAVKVETVKTDLQENVRVVKSDLSVKAAAVDAKMDNIADGVHEIHDATNSMKDALIIATEKEALRRGTMEGVAVGVQQEKDRNLEASSLVEATREVAAAVGALASVAQEQTQAATPTPVKVEVVNPAPVPVKVVQDKPAK